MCFLLLCQLPKGHQGKVPVSNAGDFCPSALRNSELGEGRSGGQRQDGQGKGWRRESGRQRDKHTYTYRKKEMGRGWVEAVGKAKPLKV